MNKNDTLAAYSDFTKWCRDNPHLDLDSRPHSHGGPIGDGGYISDEKTRVAFTAWRAAIEADRKRRGEPVAYLDLGVGGYMDVGTDLTDEQLAALPKGRHMLGIIGTYGVDGYREVAPQPAEPDVLPGEAVFGFSAWLTSLKTPVTFSECHGAAIGADLAAAYNTSQGFIQVREDFHKRLKPYPKYEPSQPAEPVKVPSDDEIIDTAISSGLAFRDSAGDVLCAWREDTDISEYLVENARALLAGYGGSHGC